MRTLELTLIACPADQAIAQTLATELRARGAVPSIWTIPPKDGSPSLDLSVAALGSHVAFVVIVSPAAARVKEMQEVGAALVGVVVRVPTKLLLWVSLHSSATAADSAWPLFREYPRIDVAVVNAGPADMETVLSQLTSLLALDASEDPDTALGHLVRHLFSRLRAPDGRVDRQTHGFDSTLPPLEALTRAKALSHREAYGQAIQRLTTLAQEFPENAIVWACLGATWNMLRHSAQAFTAYDRALVLDPHLVDAWSGEGLALVDQERWDDALACFERAVALDPGFPYQWNGLGGTLSGLGRDEEALAALDQALALDPRYGAAWYNRAEVLVALGRNNEAVEAIDHVLSAFPDDPAWWREGARVLRQLGRYVPAGLAERRAEELERAAAHTEHRQRLVPPLWRKHQ